MDSKFPKYLIDIDHGVTLALSSAAINHGIRIRRNSFQTKNQLAQTVKRAFVCFDGHWPWCDYGSKLSSTQSRYKNVHRFISNWKSISENTWEIVNEHNSICYETFIAAIPLGFQSCVTIDSTHKRESSSKKKKSF